MTKVNHLSKQALADYTDPAVGAASREEFDAFVHRRTSEGGQATGFDGSQRWQQGSKSPVMQANGHISYPNASTRRRWFATDLAPLLGSVSALLALSWYERSISFTSLVLPVAATATIFLVAQYRVNRRGPLLVISPDGLDGLHVTEKIGRRLAWSEITGAVTGPDVIIVEFAPEDPGSQDPGKRISKIRNAANPDLDAETLSREISRYMPIEHA